MTLKRILSYYVTYRWTRQHRTWRIPMSDWRTLLIRWLSCSSSILIFIYNLLYLSTFFDLTIFNGVFFVPAEIQSKFLYWHNIAVYNSGNCSLFVQVSSNFCSYSCDDLQLTFESPSVSCSCQNLFEHSLYNTKLSTN